MLRDEPSVVDRTDGLLETSYFGICSGQSPSVLFFFGYFDEHFYGTSFCAWGVCTLGVVMFEAAACKGAVRAGPALARRP